MQHRQQQRQQQQQRLLPTNSALLSTTSGADVSIVCQMFSDHVARYGIGPGKRCQLQQLLRHIPRYIFICILTCIKICNYWYRLERSKRSSWGEEPADILVSQKTINVNPNWSDAAFCDQIVSQLLAWLPWPWRWQLPLKNIQQQQQQRR